MTSQPWKQIFTIHILTNISKIKGYQTMKFGQLIEYNMKNIFCVTSCTKCGGESFIQFVLFYAELSAIEIY